MMKDISGFSIASRTLMALLLVSTVAQCYQNCSTEKVNHDCILTIDRVNVLQPPTLQMYPGASVTVTIKDALPFEQVSLDWQSSSGTLAPDQAAALLNGLNSSLQKVVAAVSLLPTAAPPSPAAPPPVAGVIPGDVCVNVTAAAAAACVRQMMLDAQLAIDDIGRLVNDDTLVYDPKKRAPVPRSLGDFDDARTRILCRILAGHVDARKLSDGTQVYCDTVSSDAPYHDLIQEQQSLALLVGPTTTGDLPALVTYTNTVIAALEGIVQNLVLLTSARSSDGMLGTIVDPERSKNPVAQSCNSSLSSGTGPFGQVYRHLLQRQVSCVVNVFNLVANSVASIPTAQQKRAIVTITANYYDTRFETSAGVMVSALPSRSFATSPVYNGAPPSLTNILVKESDTRPLILPYAAVHIRVGSDWLWPDRRRGALYATILAGVNPNTTTADFGAGFSISWRSLVLTPVAHFAHDVRLTGGLTHGEALGNSFTGSVPTQQFWTTSFGLAVGIRVPLITGR